MSVIASLKIKDRRFVTFYISAVEILLLTYLLTYLARLFNTIVREVQFLPQNAQETAWKPCSGPARELTSYNAPSDPVTGLRPVAPVTIKSWFN